MKVAFIIGLDLVTDDFLINEYMLYLMENENTNTHTRNIQLLLKVLSNPYIITDSENEWLDKYNDIVFYQIFRMQNKHFIIFCIVNWIMMIIPNLIKMKYRGGNYPVHPEKELLIFLWSLSKPNSLNSITETFIHFNLGKFRGS